MQLAMHYTDGAACSDTLNRTAVVLLHCSTSAASSQPLSLASAAELGPPHVSRVLEPSTCAYELHFHTPTVCGLYAKVRAEAAWRAQRRTKPLASAIGRIRQRSQAREAAEEEAIHTQEADDERRLLQWEELSRAAVQGSG